MSKHRFPFIAAGLGLLFMLVVMQGSELRGDGSTVLPLFTLLAISEVAFFITAIGAYLGVRHLLSAGVKPLYTIVALVCALLAVRFLFLGIALWPR